MSGCLPKNAQVFDLKQGDTMVLGCAALDAAGLAISLEDIVVQAQMRNLEDNTLVAELEVEFVDVIAGTFELWYPGVGRVLAVPADYKIDIEYSTPSGERVVARSSRTFYIRVLEGVTEGAEA